MDSKNGSMQSVTGSKNVLYMDNTNTHQRKMEMKDGSRSQNVLHAENIKIEEGSWWQRRSKLEKKLVVLFIIVFLVALALLIVLIVLQVQREPSKRELQQTTPSVPVQPRKKGRFPDPETYWNLTHWYPIGFWIASIKKMLLETFWKPMGICMTPGCVQTAARILDRANFSADPCEEFYEYACGSWMKKTDIADDQTQNNIFILLNDNMNKKLKALLEASTKEGEAGSIKKARDLYRSCLNLDKIEPREGKPLLDILSEFGGWPILNPTWEESSFQLQSVLTKLASYLQMHLIMMGMEFNPQNTSEYILSFDQPGLGMPSRDYYLRGRNDTNLMAYQAFITNVAKALGANPTSAEMQAEEIVDFIIELANITVPAIQRVDRAKLYSLWTVREMLQKYPAFNWLGYLQGIVSLEGIGISITADEVIINKAPTYFEKLFPLLENTPIRVQANYLMWMVTKTRLKLLSSKFQNIEQDYNEVILGTTTQPPRWQFCIGEVNTVMPLVVGRLFADAHFHETAKSAMVELISYLRGGFNEMIDEADWMDDTTRAVAKEKAAVIEEKIGYPNAIKNNSYLDEEYKVLNFSTTLYFENNNQVLQKGSRELFRLLRDVVDKSRWIIPPALVGAFYNPLWNEITGILQPPFYDNTQPWSMNFGSVGSFIGHEITHGFDTSGRQFDKDGAIRQWWANDVIQRFINRTKCFIEQTSSFFMPEAEMNVNGAITIGEDMADNGGMKESYRDTENIWLLRVSVTADLQQNGSSVTVSHCLNNGRISMTRSQASSIQRVLPSLPFRYILTVMSRNECSLFGAWVHVQVSSKAAGYDESGDIVSDSSSDSLDKLPECDRIQGCCVRQQGYQKWVSKQGKEEPPLPGVSLNNNQLFYLAWAQAWCTKIRPQQAQINIFTDNHSPNRLRAFSPMRNMPEFAEAYNCPKGSTMNPVKKCSLW